MDSRRSSCRLRGNRFSIDAGSPGGRDPGRIIDAVKQAGLTQIDYLVMTHYDVDHVGGVAEVAAAIPIRNFVDYGDRLPSAQGPPPQAGGARMGEPGRGSQPGAQGAPAQAGGARTGGEGRPPMMSAAEIDKAYNAARAKGITSWSMPGTGCRSRAWTSRSCRAAAR